jgi:hypothetical protein
MTIMMMGFPLSVHPTCLESPVVAAWIMSACLYAAALALG